MIKTLCVFVLSFALASCGGEANAAGEDCTGNCDACPSAANKVEGEECGGSCDGCSGAELPDLPAAPDKDSIPAKPEVGK